ncbi:MAG: intradiol ring-cleavage dioxygenase [Caldilineales bacterium]|nr:intradiol ring-cleavage dioxygenase [Caldilineales bacterium]
MDNDDRQVGRVLTRRQLLGLVGGGSLALFLGGGGLLGKITYLPMVTGGEGGTAQPTATPTSTPGGICVVRPEMTVGPYFVDEQLNRADIRSDPISGLVRVGTELRLALRVFSVGNNQCTPLPGAYVDIWHCDAAGLYSDVQNEGTVGQKFLRGYQVTDANGAANFTTIYPGWYRGRAVHIHFKIRDALVANPASYHFISQFFFEESLTDQVHSQAPYAAKGTRDTHNSEDNIYLNSGGEQMVLPVVQVGSHYEATFDIAFALD